MLRKKIKNKIQENENIKEFSNRVGITSSQLYNFLNGKTGLGSENLEKILKSLNLEIEEPLPGVIESIESFEYNGKKYSLGIDFEEMCIRDIYMYRKTVFLILKDSLGNDLLRVLKV